VEARLRALLRADPVRMALLEAVRTLALPDCWIAAGMVRNASWDHLHGRAPAPPDTDIDVIWFDGTAGRGADRALEERLRGLLPGAAWSVKNQARMHLRNGDPPYRDAEDALRYWPDTATAVAVRLDASGELDVLAPFGLRDLFDGVLRPTPHCAARKPWVFSARVAEKAWLTRWPRLHIPDTHA
jgi:hypothetical protein